MTITEIIEAAGGDLEVAYHLGPMHTHTVERWPKSGIPKKHWDGIIDLAAARGVTITVQDIWNANKAVETKVA